MPRSAAGSAAFRAALALALALASTLVVAACEPASPATAPSAAPTEPAQRPSAAPTLTPVPGAPTSMIDPFPSRGPTTQTEWGEILATLPDSFPIFPGAGLVDLPETATASLSAEADAESVAAWYADTLAGLGYQVDASDPLEDGGRALDVRADLPECRLRIDFRPAADSTIITVLYGAGCAGAGG